MSKLWHFPLQPHQAKSWMILLQDDKSSLVREFGFRFNKVAIMKLSKSLLTPDLLLSCFFVCLFAGERERGGCGKP